MVNLVKKERLGYLTLLLYLTLQFFCTADVFGLAENLFQKKYISTNWMYSNGFPANSAVDVIQNEEEYIWIATYDGLIRFDGKDFKIFNRYTDDGYNALSATKFFEDSKKRLWIATNESGVALYEKGSFEMIGTKEGLSSDIVRCIKEDKDGNILVGTAKGLSRLEKEKQDGMWRIETLISNNDIKDIEIMGDDRVLVALNTGVILSFFDNRIVNYSLANNIGEYKFQSIFSDLDENVWLGTTSGEVIKIKKDGNMEIFKNPEVFSINSIFGLDYGSTDKYIVFCSDKGVGVFDEKKDAFQVFCEENGLINNSVEKIFVDKESNIWIASKRIGLQKLTPSKFTNYTEELGLSYNIINAIEKDVDDNYWIGSNKGLSIIKDEEIINNNFTRLLKDTRIRHIMSDSKNHLWISTYSDWGLIKVEGNKFTEINMERGLSSNKVRVTFEDGRGRVWIGTTGGLNMILNPDDEKLKIIKNFNKLSTDYVMCIGEDDNENILVGSDGQGIFVIDKNFEVKNISKKDGLAGDVIFKILKDKENNIWIATNEGVSLAKNDRFYNFNSNDGFLSDSIFQIIEEGEYFWFTTAKGIFSIKKKELLDQAESEKRSFEIYRYGMSDGFLDSSTPNSWGINDGQGKLWFPTLSGVSVFDRNNLNINKKNPKVIFQYLDIDGVKYDIKEDMVINPGTKRIKIKYSALSYQIPQKVKFKYYLEGFDEGWSEETIDREIVYTNLPYGDYTFYLKAANNDGVWTEEPYTLSFYRKPFFYETKIFQLIVQMSAVILTAIFFLLKIRQLKEKRKHISKTLEDTITALTSAIDAKDSYTKGHSLRVAEISEKIGIKMNMEDEELTRLKYSALLHDIGKIGINDNIIKKKGPLTDSEYEHIKQHPLIGGNILDKDSLKQFLNGAKYHHEKFDGSGYCGNLKGEEIPIEARIIAIADVYDAMTSDRPYRKGVSKDDTMKEINKNSGKHFDPKVVTAFNKVVEAGEID